MREAEVGEEKLDLRSFSLVLCFARSLAGFGKANFGKVSAARGWERFWGRRARRGQLCSNPVLCSCGDFILIFCWTWV